MSGIDYDAMYDRAEHMTSLASVVLSGPLVLHVININKKGASSNTLTIYDGPDTTCPVVAVIDTTVNVGSLLFDKHFARGLTLVMATGTAADLTVITG